MKSLLLSSRGLACFGVLILAACDCADPELRVTGTEPPPVASSEPTPAIAPSNTPVSPVVTPQPPATETSIPIPLDPLNPCNTRQFLSMPFDPALVDHGAFQDGPRRYGMYWFDIGEGTRVLDWRGMSDTYDGHRGTDVVLSPGTPVYAAAAGTVVNVWSDRIDLDHGCGYFTSYHHIDPSVELGEHVGRGQEVGKVNSEPPTTHLHFQLEVEGVQPSPSYDGLFGYPTDPFPDRSNPAAINYWTSEAFLGWLSMPELAAQ